VGLSSTSEEIGTTTEALVRISARALARNGLATAFGHCSARISDSAFVVSPMLPLGLIRPYERLPTVPIRGPLPDEIPGEVCMHQAIYERRPDVGGICRFHSPILVALSSQQIVPVARHGHGAYFYPAPPYWDRSELVRNPNDARLVAERIGEASAIVLRGNGALTVGEDLRFALALAWFLEDTARVELISRQLGSDVTMSEEEAMTRGRWDGRILERAWQYLTQSDAEQSSSVEHSSQSRLPFEGAE
jgi:HCOMODA/2-hydroxy-3-carboxy-muconic semialdehyde decarboxylase